jgi:hypothetical protein
MDERKNMHRAALLAAWRRRRELRLRAAWQRVGFLRLESRRTTPERAEAPGPIGAAWAS